MYSLIDGLIFPAPKPSYTTESMKGKIIFIPKFRDFFTIEKLNKYAQDIEQLKALEDSLINISSNLSEGAQIPNEENDEPQVICETSSDENQFNMSETSLQQQLQETLKKGDIYYQTTTIAAPPKSQINLESKNYKKMLINQKLEKMNQKVVKNTIKNIGAKRTITTLKSLPKIDLKRVNSPANINIKNVKELYFSTSIVQSQRQQQELIKFQSASKNILSQRLLSDQRREQVRSVLSIDSRASQPYVFGIIKGAPSVIGKKDSDSDSFNINQLNPKANTLQNALHSINQREKFRKVKNQINKLKEMIQQYEKYGNNDFIPCLHFRGNSKKVLIHFHANGEDIYHTQHLLSQMVNCFKINTICVEFPGYGIYKKHFSSEQKRSKQIQKDAETVYNFIMNSFKVSERDIMVSGRSIGSGPACHLAANFDPLCLILISPIKSVNHIARKICGRLTDFLIEERFNNIEVVKTVKCPTAILHGINDEIVDSEDSVDLLMKGFISSKTHLFLREKMRHNKFDYEHDLLRPLQYFFYFHQIAFDLRNQQVFDFELNPGQNILRKQGYIETIKSTSKYYNNFSMKPPENTEYEIYHNEQQQGQLQQMVDQDVEPLKKMPDEQIDCPLTEEFSETEELNKSGNITDQSFQIQNDNEQYRKFIENTNINNQGRIIEGDGPGLFKKKKVIIHSSPSHQRALSSYLRGTQSIEESRVISQLQQRAMSLDRVNSPWNDSEKNEGIHHRLQSNQNYFKSMQQIILGDKNSENERSPAGFNSKFIMDEIYYKKPNKQIQRAIMDMNQKIWKIKNPKEVQDPVKLFYK